MAKDLQKDDVAVLPKLPGAFSVRPCAYCSKEFIGWDKTKYCSVECRKSGFFQPTKGLGINKNCKSCGKEFYVSLSSKRQTHCSIQCRAESQKVRINKVCPVCNKGFEVKRSWDRVKYCSMKCRNISMRKKNYPNEAMCVRRSMKKNGLITECNRCGYHDHIEILQTHHIDRDRNNNCLENIEVLCPNCHAIEHYLKPIEGISLTANI